MTAKKPANDAPKGEVVLYQTEDGRTRVEVRFEGDWLSLRRRRRGFIPRPGGAT